MNCTFLVFTSDGLCTVGQMEVVIVLDTLPSDTTIPLDIFRQYEYLYQNALKGKIYAYCKLWDTCLFEGAYPSSEVVPALSTFLGCNIVCKKIS